MRIGEILLSQAKLRETELAQALAEQAETGRRLCSMLIGRGLLDFDDAARALGEQWTVRCALRKHLELRDRDLAEKLPAELARACCALPIARTRSGDLIIVVRDPTPHLAAALQQGVQGRIQMLVAPATELERIVEEVYGGVPSDELDVDMTTGPIALPPRADMALLDPDSISFALTSLDDDRVTKDPSQSGHLKSSMPAAPPPPPIRVAAPTPPRTPTPAMGRPIAAPPARPTPPPEPPAPPPRAAPAATLPPFAPTFDTTEREMGRATTRDVATDIAMEFITGRWVAAVMLAVRDGAAIGYRGHGRDMPPIGEIRIPLGERSTVQRAAETRRTAVKQAEGTIEEPVEAMLGQPQVLAVAPVMVRGHVVAVIAVGDPILGSTEIDDAIADLGLLAEALSGAYERIHAKR
ncbi:MAG: hypothetical protein JWO36_2872 [Myxococcales bacterium]|nr:hypothetical protein [Myxococcales bacterium]